MSFDRRTTADEVVEISNPMGRRILITGATSGIGFETARALAAGGARVTIAGRDATRTERACDRITEMHPGVLVDPLPVDLASLDSIRQGAEMLQDASLDVLICNAGLISDRYLTTEEGFERTVGVCHVGHFLLTHLVLPKLEASGGGRVVVVASESHRSPATLDFDRLPLTEEKYRPMIAYGQAKLCNVLFANELNRRVASRGVTSNSLHPGTMIPTGIGRGWLLARIAMLAMRPFTRSVAQGAATSCYVATAPELDGIGGRYFDECAESEPSAEAVDADVAARLWSITEGWAGIGEHERIR